MNLFNLVERPQSAKTSRLLHLSCLVVRHYMPVGLVCPLYFLVRLSMVSSLYLESCAAWHSLMFVWTFSAPAWSVASCMRLSTLHTSSGFPSRVVQRGLTSYLSPDFSTMEMASSTLWYLFLALPSGKGSVSISTIIFPPWLIVLLFWVLVGAVVLSSSEPRRERGPH